MAGNIANLRPPWPKGVSGNPKGRPPSKLERILKRMLEEEADEQGTPNVEALARAVLKAALKRAGSMERKALLDREYPAVERHEVEVIQADHDELESRLAALAASRGTNGVDRHANGSGSEGSS
jgi:hypothetical protein